MKRLIYPGDYSNNGYPFMALIEDVQVDNKIFFYFTYDYQFYDTLITDVNPDFFESDFRCPIAVAEYDDSKVEWKVFPNPSNSEFNLIASGLICGKEYKVDVIDVAGKLMYETQVHAKTSVVLPVENYSPGIYFIRIHSLKGLIVQKVIKL